MSSLPTFHDQTTIIDPSGNTTAANTTTPTTTSTTHTRTHQDILPSTTHNTTTPTTANNTSNLAQNETDTISTVPSTIPRDRLNSEYEPTREIEQPRGSLSSTTGPFQVPTTDDVSKKDVPPTSSVGQQSAPGRAGSIGDGAIAALGFGGSKVERPKEDQGIGEKIINFLGA